MNKHKVKWLAFSTATLFSGAASGTTAFAGNDTVTNLLSQKSSNASISGMVNSGLTYAVTAITAISGGWFLFHLYAAIMGFISSARHAQKREDAKSHLIHVAFSGVALGAALYIASALYNFGQTLGKG